MIKNILPEIILNCLRNYNIQDIYEMRLRTGSPIVINYKGRNISLLSEVGSKIYVTKEIIEYVLKQATECSIYAFNNQIKQGFITTKGGVRLGISGESVNSDNFMPTTIKNINSINIRVPHEIVGCSNSIFKYVYIKDVGVKNTLIISPPGAGKTTLLRDIARNLSSVEKIYNCLIVDERFELASVVNGEKMLDVGYYSDIVSGATKMFAFTNAIRAMRPDVIITDELMGVDDVLACERAVCSGVKIIASVHAENHRDLLNKEEFKDLTKNKIFERYVILNGKDKPGKIDAILDENFNCLYF